MVLEEGKIYTNAELAQWFDIAVGTFKNTKKKRLSELSEYATYEICKGGKIKVLRVFEKEYCPKRSYNKEIVHVHFFDGWSKTMIDTSRRAANKFYSLHGEKMTVTEETSYRYYCQERVARFGKDGGTDGREEKHWGTFNEATQEFELLTEEENKIYQELKKKYCDSYVEDEMQLAQETLQGEIKGHELDLCEKEIKKKKQAAFLGLKREWKRITKKDLYLCTILIPCEI